jgi:hypothetical protein
LRSRARKPSHAAGIGRAVGLLHRVAAGGVDQHRLVGEPPVAVAGAADTAHARVAELLGERERETAFSSAVVLPEPGAPMKMYQGSS